MAEVKDAAATLKVIVSFSADYCNQPTIVGQGAAAKGGWVFSGTDGRAVVYSALTLQKLMRDVAMHCTTIGLKQTPSFVFMCCEGGKIAPAGELKNDDAFDVVYYRGKHPSGLLPYSGAALAGSGGDMAAFIRGHDAAMDHFIAMETAANEGRDATEDHYKSSHGFTLSKWDRAGARYEISSARYNQSRSV